MDYHCSVNAEPPICFCLSCCHLWQLHSPLAMLHRIVANFDVTPHFGSLYHSQCPCSPCCIAFFLILTPPHVHFDFSSCCYCSCCHHSLDGGNKCWRSLYCCHHARLIVGWYIFPCRGALLGSYFPFCCQHLLIVMAFVAQLNHHWCHVIEPWLSPVVATLPSHHFASSVIDVAISVPLLLLFQTPCQHCHNIALTSSLLLHPCPSCIDAIGRRYHVAKIVNSSSLHCRHMIILVMSFYCILAVYYGWCQHFCHSHSAHIKVILLLAFLIARWIHLTGTSPRLSVAPRYASATYTAASCHCHHHGWM